MNLFLDNVPTLAIQGPIIRKVPKIFCPTVVNDMDSVKVNEIAGESEERVSYRKELLQKLATLENGARICHRFSLKSRHGE
jgi:hypothetical protein